MLKFLTRAFCAVKAEAAEVGSARTMPAPMHGAGAGKSFAQIWKEAKEQVVEGYQAFREIEGVRKAVGGMQKTMGSLERRMGLGETPMKRVLEVAQGVGQTAVGVVQAMAFLGTKAADAVGKKLAKMMDQVMGLDSRDRMSFTQAIEGMKKEYGESMERLRGTRDKVVGTVEDLSGGAARGFREYQGTKGYTNVTQGARKTLAGLVEGIREKNDAAAQTKFREGMGGATQLVSGVVQTAVFVGAKAASAIARSLTRLLNDIENTRGVSPKKIELAPETEQKQEENKPTINRFEKGDKNVDSPLPKVGNAVEVLESVKVGPTVMNITHRGQLKEVTDKAVKIQPFGKTQEKTFDRSKISMREITQQEKKKTMGKAAAQSRGKVQNREKEMAIGF